MRADSMVKLDVRFEMKQVEKMFNDLPSKITKPAARDALNKSIKKVQKEAVRDVARTIRAPQKVIKERIRHQKRDKATVRRLTAQIFAVVSDLPAIKVGKARQTKKGVTVKGYKYPGSFIATIKQTQHVGIYKRVGKPRLPIKEQKIPVREMIDKTTLAKIDGPGQREFGKNYTARITVLLKREGAL